MPGVKKRTNRRRRPVEQWQSFLFEIEKVHSHYSFGNGWKWSRTAHSEHLHPEFEANCLSPEKYKGRKTRFTLIGDRADERDLWLQTPGEEYHAGVGTLTFRGERSDYLGGVPFDALWKVVAAYLAGNLHFIHVHGAAMKHGSARMTSISFYDEFDIDDA